MYCRNLSRAKGCSFTSKRPRTVSLSFLNLRSKCMQSKTWENSILQLKQLDGIGIGNARLLSNAGIHSFQKILLSDARTIEYAVNRNPPFGNKIIDSIKRFPLFSMDISEVILNS